MKASICIVVPVYKSQKSLSILIERSQKALQAIDSNPQFIFVDDSGYKINKSWDILKKLQADNKANIHLIKLSGNYGQPIATVCGLIRAKADYVVTLDDDCQYPPEEISRLIDFLEEQKADIALGIGHLEKIKSKFKIKVLNFIKQFLKQGNHTTRYGSSFRLIRGSICQNLIDDFNRLVIIDIFLLEQSTKFVYLPIETMPRMEGKSGYSYMKVFKRLTNIIGYYTTIPLKAIIIIVFFILLIVLNLLNVSDLPVYIKNISFNLIVLIILFGVYLTLRIYQGFWEEKAKMRHESKHYIEEEIVN